MISIKGFLIFIFFLTLYAKSDYKHLTYLNKQDQKLLYDAILSLAIYKTIRSFNILQHYPAITRIADINSIALFAKTLARKDSSQE
tara:strand:- start:720 stop:977 length:258 start_codon:yes stop_codon:yes gene_type:complete